MFGLHAWLLTTSALNRDVRITWNIQCFKKVDFLKHCFYFFGSLPQKRFSKYHLLVHYKLQRVKSSVYYNFVVKRYFMWRALTAEQHQISRYHIFNQWFKWSSSEIIEQRLVSQELWNPISSNWSAERFFHISYCNIWRQGTNKVGDVLRLTIQSHFSKARF